MLAGETSTANTDPRAQGLQHCLLIMHWDSYIVALPVEFGSHVTDAQQAKSLIAHQTKQLVAVLQSLNTIIPKHTTAAANKELQGMPH